VDEASAAESVELALASLESVDAESSVESVDDADASLESVGAASPAESVADALESSLPSSVGRAATAPSLPVADEVELSADGRSVGRGVASPALSVASAPSSPPSLSVLLSTLESLPAVMDEQSEEPQSIDGMLLMMDEPQSEEEEESQSLPLLMDDEPQSDSELQSDDGGRLMDEPQSDESQSELPLLTTTGGSWISVQLELTEVDDPQIGALSEELMTLWQSDHAWPHDWGDVCGFQLRPETETQLLPIEEPEIPRSPKLISPLSEQRLLIWPATLLSNVGGRDSERCMKSFWNDCIMPMN